MFNTVSHVPPKTYHVDTYLDPSYGKKISYWETQSQVYRTYMAFFSLITEIWVLKTIFNRLSIPLSISLPILNFTLQTMQSTVQNSILHDRLHGLLEMT
jgi:hypothetical protein